LLFKIRPDFNKQIPTGGWEGKEHAYGRHPTRCGPESAEKSSVRSSKELIEFDSMEDIARCMKKQRNVFVVVIDDDQDQAELIKEVLAPEGYSVLTADNSEEGLELSQRYQPFVIITDFGMPDMDGAELVERLKVNGASDIPVVLVTAYPPEYVEERLDFNHFPDLIMSKPVDFDLLVETVRGYYQNDYQPELCVQDRPQDCFASASLAPQLSGAR
jgi:CheY-like chemotaxis protein